MLALTHRQSERVRWVTAVTVSVVVVCLGPFRGRWVAIGDEGEVIADAGSLAELRTVLRTIAPDQHVLVRRCLLSTTRSSSVSLYRR